MGYCCSDYDGDWTIFWVIVLMSCIIGFFIGGLIIAQKLSPVCVDGDTFKIAGTTYRLSNVDTPEKGEKNYTKASEYTCKLLNENVFALTKHGEDKYNRTLTEVKTKDNKDLGYLLIENCLAEPFYGNTTDEIINAYKNNCQ